MEKTHSKYKRKKHIWRAQAGIETMLVLAIGIFIVLFLVSMTYEQINSSRENGQQVMAQNAVNTLAREIDDAYFLGPGTVKDVKIQIPTGVDFDNSFISEKSVVLRIAGTDAVASTTAEVEGQWPNTNNSVVFSVVAYEDKVIVSSQELAFNPSKISESLQDGDTKDVTLSIENITENQKEYSLSVTGDTAGSYGSATLSTGSLTIPASSSESINVQLACDPAAFGNYNGRIEVTPQQEPYYTTTVPISIFCRSGTRTLISYPREKQITLPTSTTTTQTLTICNTSNTLLTNSNVTYTGNISGQISTSFSGNIGINSCVPLTLNISTGGTPGTYSGSVIVTTIPSFTTETQITLIVE